MTVMLLTVFFLVGVSLFWVVLMKGRYKFNGNYLCAGGGKKLVKRVMKRLNS